MLTLRKAQERGHFNHGWLETYHSFSFAEYYDPAQMGFRALRVINEDRIAPGGGFPPHPHEDMEILTYVISGALAHRDSMGSEGVIRAGNVQGMSAGTGVRHSEFNASGQEPVHLLQIWIVPQTKSVAPAYSEWNGGNAAPNAWTLAASGDGAQGSLRITRDARLYVARFDRKTALDVPLAPGRFGWMQVALGRAALNDTPLEAGDGIAFAAEDHARITAEAGATLLWFDLA